MHTKLLKILFLIFLPAVFYSQTASFYSDTVNGCIPFAVTFTNNSANGVSYNWDFGDGTQSSLETPSNTYTQAGIYSVKLIVSFSNSPNDTLVINNYIEVFDAPTADFQFAHSGTFCENDNLFTFTNNSLNATAYTWDFGDGNTDTTTNPSHTYSSDGTHIITLIAQNNYCSSNISMPALNIDEIPTINASVSDYFSCDSSNLFNFTATANPPVGITWDWDFGDGSSSSIFNPNHQYNSSGNFSSFVIGTNNNGCKDTIYLNNIQIFEVPFATINSALTSGCEPFNSNFNIHSTGDSIASISWDFGDGSIISSTTDTISHLYNSGGVFNVNAQITDINGCDFQLTQINPIVVNAAPTATYSATNTYGCSPLTVLFNSSTNINNSIEWNFGDDTAFVNQSSPSHTYVSNGLFFPQLTITDSLGCSSTYSLDTINSGAFSSEFTSSTQNGCAPLNVDFFSTNSGATNWFWDFGDGNSSTLPNPTHTYNTADTFDVSLVIWNNLGCIDTTNYEAYIQTQAETINLPTADTISTCSPFVFNPDVQNLGLTNYQWDFGDGTLGSGANPLHVYDNSGVFNAQLSATSPNGCLVEIDDFAFLEIDGLDIDIEITTSVCDSSSVSISNNSTGISTSQWILGSDTLSTNSIFYDFTSSDPTLIEYNAISSIGCQVNQYIPIVFDCNNASNDTIMITPPLDTMPMDPNNPGSVITYVSIDYSCGPEMVNLYSPFESSQNFYWDFGDGFTSNDMNPSHLYNSSGIFHLLHYGIAANGDTSVFIIDYFITQHVAQVDFSYSESISCNSSNVSFTDNSPNANTWLWAFGNGNTSLTQNSSFTFPIDNTSKTVSLTITDSTGCSATKTSVLYFYEPIIDVDIDTLICFGDTLALNAQTNSLFTYNWDMGDGASYSTQFINHEYLNAGIYNIALNVTDNNGCIRNVINDPINVFSPVSTFTPNTPQFICVGESIEFISDNQNLGVQHNWYSPWHRYGSSVIQFYNITGTFDVTHRVIENGCISELTITNLITVNEAETDFSFTQTSACLPVTVNFQDLSPNAVSWHWNFGDGNFSSAQNPHHNFSFVPSNDITLTIVDANGCTGSHSLSTIDTLNNDFSISDTVICVNSSVQFNANSNLATNFIWDFGDGTTSNLSNPSHQYTDAGFYDISLIIEAGQGCIDTITSEDLVEVQQVIADFSYTSPGNCPPIISSFNNNSSGATDYIWYFGDSSTSILQNPSHVYTSAGNYDISLVATNEIGCYDSIVGLNPIYIPGPVIDFNINQILGCDSLTIDIQNNTSNAVSYEWDFDDGSLSNDINPTHTYSSTGNYVIILSATDTSGCQSYLLSPVAVEVIPTPTASFASSVQNTCVPNAFSVINSSLNATSYNWTFGNQINTVPNPSFGIFMPGIQSIELIANNQICSDTVTHQITGHFQPAVSILDPGSICANENNINLQTSSIFNSNVTWSGNGVSSNGTLDPSNLGGSSINIIASTSGYCASSDSIQIDIISPPDATIITNSIQICEGESLPNLIAQTNGGIWNGPNTNPMTGAINSSNINNGNYSIYYSINGVCSDTDSIELTVLNQPEATILNPGLICSNETVSTLNSTTQGGIWNGNYINSSTGKINISNLGIGYHNFTYSFSGDCPASDTIEIEINEFLEAQIMQPNSICEGNHVENLISINSNGIWTGIGIADPAIGLFNSAGLSEGVYTITHQTSGLCGDLDSIYVYINPLPILDYEFEAPNACVGSQINIINNSTNISNESYQWFIDDSLISNTQNPTFSLDLGGYVLSVEITNQFGCKIKHYMEESLVVYDTTPLPAPEIIRSTVINDLDVYTEWAPKQNAVNTVKEYVLFKSKDQETYDYIGTFEPIIDNYIDENVDVYNENYTYYVVSINQCNVPSNASNISSSVLLGYEKPNEFQTILRWTSYEKWKEGVNRYEVQKLNEYGQWDVIKILNHDINNTIVDP